MQSILDNYINGNLTTAKSLSKRVRLGTLRDFLRVTGGMEPIEAYAVAAFLKGQGTFQEACDASPQAQESGVRS